MNLKDLIARGALVESAPTPREITWTPPNTTEALSFTVYVRSPSCGWQDRMRMAAARAGNDRISYDAAIISHAIVFGDDGTESFTYDQAYVLDPGLRDALMLAYNSVNAPPPVAPPDTDKKEDFAKNTGPTHGSGTNSSKPASAAEASQQHASH